MNDEPARTACACGTRRTASSTTCCTSPGRRAACRCGPLDGRAHPALRGGDARGDVARALPGVREAREVVHLEPARARRGASRRSIDNGHGQAAPPLDPRSRSARARARARARRERVPLAVRRARALARRTRTEPYEVELDGAKHRVDYEPGESPTGLFGGNSNWRGPVWFPVNYLIIESLQKYHHYYGDELPRRVPDAARARA